MKSFFIARLTMSVWTAPLNRVDEILLRRWADDDHLDWKCNDEAPMNLQCRRVDEILLHRSADDECLDSEYHDEATLNLEFLHHRSITMKPR